MWKKAVIKLHIIFWIAVILISFPGTFTYFGNKLFIPLLVSTIMLISFNCFSFYLFYIIITPSAFNKNRIILLLLSGLAYLALSGYIFTYISYYPYTYFYPVSVPADLTPESWVRDFAFGVIAGNTTYSVLGSLSKITLLWYRNKIKQMETEKQNMSNELAMLRAQINPHFLFNTLNNIKSLIKSLPAKAIQSIERLTGIMHYMLFSSSLETVPLSDEINHINNYIDLEKIRYADPEFISFSTSGDYSKIKVPPLVFVPFIENAFKHGNKLKPAPGIIIRIDVEQGNKISFESKNYIKEANEIAVKNSGFGLPNIRRRLDLLFDNKYTLKIDTSGKTFGVKLNLDLT
jgi:two-component system, LytTR family, sensor kinase